MRERAEQNRLGNVIVSRAFRRGPTALLLSVGLCSNLFVFGPFTIYLGNLEEFSVPLVSIIAVFLLPALVGVGLLSLLGLLLPERLYRPYLCLLGVVGVLVWIQGNLLVWNYGPLDGSQIDWGEGRWRGWLDGWVWLCGLALVLSGRPWLSAGIVRVVAVLVVAQLGSLGIQSVRQPGVWSSSGGFPRPTLTFEQFCQVSEKENVFHLLFDAFQSDIFEEIVQGNPDYYAEKLPGFTFFRDTLGSFPSTYLSIPAIVSGVNYRNQEPIPEFVATALLGDTLWKRLDENAYRVDLASGIPYKELHRSSSWGTAASKSRSTEGRREATALQLLDLVLFRHAPHFFKRVVYNNQAWLLRRILPRDDPPFIQLDHQAFFDDFTAGLRVVGTGRRYKYLHLFTTHAPPVVSEECRYAGEVLAPTWDNFKIQDDCALQQFVRFLDRLRADGLYDSSLIILHADTGMGITKPAPASGALQTSLVSANVISVASPLLLIKPPYATAPFRISDAQVALTDIPATIADLLRLDHVFPGKSAYQVDPHQGRPRHFHYYPRTTGMSRRAFLAGFSEYLVLGPKSASRSWRTRTSLPAPPRDAHPPLTQEVDFGTEGGRAFLRSGWWDFDEKDEVAGLTYTWAVGAAASIVVALPRDEPTTMTARITTVPFPRPQRIAVSVDGGVVGHWDLPNRWEWGEYRLTIPPNPERRKRSVIEFAFSQHRASAEGADPRPIAVLFDTLALQAARE